MSAIGFEEFARIGFIIGTIVKAEVFPEAHNPSYKAAVDFGNEGIKHSCAQLPANYQLEQIRGKKVLGVVNLPPRRIAGFKSEALIVGFPDINKHVFLLNARHGYNVANGSLLAESGDQSKEIAYDDFQKAEIRSATIVSLKALETDTRSFYAQLDAGPFGIRSSILYDIEPDFAHSLTGAQVPALLNLRPKCSSEKSYDAMILTLFAQKIKDHDDSKISTSLRIPFGVDGPVKNGEKLF